jgi:hypothetical protein
MLYLTLSVMVADMASDGKFVCFGLPADNVSPLKRLVKSYVCLADDGLPG